MRYTRLGVGVCLLCAALLGEAQGATLKLEVTELGPAVLGGAGSGGSAAGLKLQRYTYFLSDIILMCDQELNIRFDPTLFLSLSNPQAEPGFDVLLLQPNQPVGAYGDFSALALCDRDKALANFSVDVIYLGGGGPSQQPYFINQFDESGGFRTLESGLTALEETGGVPEPATAGLCGVALIAFALWRSRK